LPSCAQFLSHLPYSIIVALDMDFSCNWSDFSVALGLSGAAGIRATLPVFLVTLLHQLDAKEYPIWDQLPWLAQSEVCMLFGLLLIIEMLIDSIPALDHVGHAILLPAYPILGGLVAISPDYCGGLITRVPLAIFGGLLAGLVHFGKGIARMGSTASSGGFLTPVVSNCETLCAIAVLVFSIFSPTFALVAVAFFIYLAFLGLRWAVTQATADQHPSSEKLYPPAAQKRSHGGFKRGKTDYASAPSAPPLDEVLNPRKSSETRGTLAVPQKDATAGVPLPVPDFDGGISSGDPRKDAQREVERVMAAPNPHMVLGGGNVEQTRREFKRIVLLLHPDRGYVQGERASLALRRVVEANQTLHGSP